MNAALLASPPSELADVMRSSAESPGESAAVELLVLHGIWLARPEFRKCLWVDSDTGACRIRFIALAKMARQTFHYPDLTVDPDLVVLRLACSLAGQLPSPAVGVGWTIGAMLGELPAWAVVEREAVAVALLGLAQGRWAS